MAKSPDAFRTISEVAEWLDRPAHVLRFWESKFTQVKPVKRAGGRRYYRRQDMLLLGGIKKLLHDDGMTIKGVQKLLRDNGVKHVTAMSQPLNGEEEDHLDTADQGNQPVPLVEVDAQVEDNLVPFPSPATDNVTDAEATAEPAATDDAVTTKKKPPFEREPEQALLFEVADSIAPELDDIYLADPNAPVAEDPEEIDVPLPFGDADTVDHPSISAAGSPHAALGDLDPKPGLLSVLLHPSATVDAADGDALRAIRTRLQDHATALKALA